MPLPATPTKWMCTLVHGSSAGRTPKAKDRDSEQAPSFEPPNDVKAEGRLNDRADLAHL
jgi:hypothetical protein